MLRKGLRIRRDSPVTPLWHYLELLKEINHQMVTDRIREIARDRETETETETDRQTDRQTDIQEQ